MTAEHKHGAWFADQEGTIKRQAFDLHGEPIGYELLAGKYPKEWAVATELLAACEAVAAHDRCGADVLNPCWDNRPTDQFGKHWGGGEACTFCKARAAIDKVEVSR